MSGVGQEFQQLLLHITAPRKVSIPSNGSSTGAAAAMARATAGAAKARVSFV